jgi:hypothetical protein
MGSSASIRMISVPMRARLLRYDPDDLESLGCLNCGSALELSQPDADSPERLLGICHSCCSQCGSWHVISADDESEVVMVLLPERAIIREAIILAGADEGPDDAS